MTTITIVEVLLRMITSLRRRLQSAVIMDANAIAHKGKRLASFENACCNNRHTPVQDWNVEFFSVN